MNWTLQNLKDSENKQQMSLYTSIFSAATEVGYRKAELPEPNSAVFGKQGAFHCAADWNTWRARAL
jgi:hypothetical protein